MIIVPTPDERVQRHLIKVLGPERYREMMLAIRRLFGEDVGGDP